MGDNINAFLSSYYSIFALHAHNMEQNIAILIADLSGYTALTEVHGPSAAADIIDTYVDLVQTSLVGNSRLHGRTGDEVLIISDAADALLATSVLLLQKAHRQPEFLQLHGALHYGRVLNRNNDYFGNTVNLTSRMASKANAGTMVCSTDFIQALNNKEVLQFHSKGKYSFKNVSEEKEVFELIIDRPDTYYTDPICRMLVNVAQSQYMHPINTDILFCSQHCLDMYLRNESKA
jgi:adenylate cyclase